MAAEAPGAPARSTAPREARAPGRPRSFEVDRAILDATVALFISHGFEAMSVEQVAAHAGVGKATIYRRWACKEALVSEAVAGLTEEIRVPDTGSVRGDLEDIMVQLLRTSATSASGKCFARMAGEISANQDFAHVFRRNVISPRRSIVARVLRRGIERGELRDDLDLDLATDMLVGPIIYRRLFGALPSSAPENPRELIDTLLNGISTPAAPARPEPGT